MLSVLATNQKLAEAEALSFPERLFFGRPAAEAEAGEDESEKRNAMTLKQKNAGVEDLASRGAAPLDTSCQMSENHHHVIAPTDGGHAVRGDVGKRMDAWTHEAGAEPSRINRFQRGWPRGPRHHSSSTRTVAA